MIAHCDHRSAFLFAYIDTTEAVARAVTTPGTFADPRNLTLFDAVFARNLFDAADASEQVRDDDVPPAWGIALQAVADKATTSIGDLLLGMNAHITRDLPFVVAAMGTTAPNGSSRKPDFDAMNTLIAGLQTPMLNRASRRLDPTLAHFSVPGLQLDNTTFAALITAWRNEAWQNGVALGTRARDAFCRRHRGN